MASRIWWALSSVTLFVVASTAGIAWATSAAPATGPAPGMAPPVQQFILANGLTVLLRPVADANQVAVVTLFSIGNDHDPQGKCGLAHLVEHLYTCCGAGDTKPRTAEQFFRQYPSRWNACTGDDYTLYATIVSRETLAAELSDAAARMGALNVTGGELDREKARLISEVGNMFGGMPALAAGNLVRQQIRPGVEGTRRGGLPEQVRTISLADIRDRLDRFYKPRNAVLAVAGGFDVAQIKAVIEKQFGSLPSGEGVAVAASLQPPKLGATATTNVKPIRKGESQQVCIGFAAPRPDDAMYGPFLVLVTRMVARQAAIPCQIHFAPLDDPAVFSLIMAPQAQETPQAAIDRLGAFVEGVSTDPMNPGDAQATLFGMGVLLGLVDMPDAMWAQNPYGLAFSLGRRYQLGFDPVKLRKAVEGVKTDDLRRAAGELFAAKKRAAVIVQPTE